MLSRHSYARKCRAATGDRGFQATYIIFPTPGCWEVTGRVGDAKVTFITRVVKIGDGKRGDATFRNCVPQAYARSRYRSAYQHLHRQRPS